MDQLFIQRIVEAALLAAPQPLTLTQLTALFPDNNAPPPGSLEQAITSLRDASDERGVELVEVASGFRFQVKADVYSFVSRLWAERQTKYTRATLETLALIAYRQPITRGEIEQIRGVAVSSNTIKMLEEREWIRSIGHRDVPGRPELFGTTKAFLDYFGLKSLDQLPPLAELKDIIELEPQLPFDAPPIKAASAMPTPTEQSNSDTLSDIYNTDQKNTIPSNTDQNNIDQSLEEQSLEEQSLENIDFSETSTKSHDKASDTAEPELKNE